MYIEEKNKGPVFSKLAKIILLFTGIVLGIISSRLFILPFTVCDDSMSPNIKKGEIVYILKYISPEVGDVVLLKSPAEPDRALLKRMIARDGDTIEIRGKVFYKNNQKFRFNWETISNDDRIFPMDFSYRDNFPLIKINRKEFFVIGDNLDYSYDSRSFGVVDEEKIIGTVIFKI